MKFSADGKFKELPTGVIFDLDNTLYDYNSGHLPSLKAVEEKACRRFGITEKRFRHELSEARNEVKSKTGFTAASHNRLLYFHCLCESILGKSSPVLALDYDELYWETFLSNIKLYPEAREFIEDLRREGVKVGLLTDMVAHIQFRKLMVLGLENIFDFVVTSEETGIEKPGTKAFKCIMQRLGVTPSECWMIGDDIKKDICGFSQFSGATTICKMSSSTSYRKALVFADAAFEKFSDLRLVVRNLQVKPCQN